MNLPMYAVTINKKGFRQVVKTFKNEDRDKAFDDALAFVERKTSEDLDDYGRTLGTYRVEEMY